jgi:hypothetical protein
MFACWRKDDPLFIFAYPSDLSAGGTSSTWACETVTFSGSRPGKLTLIRALAQIYKIIAP